MYNQEDDPSLPSSEFWIKAIQTISIDIMEIQRECHSSAVFMELLHALNTKMNFYSREL